MAGTWKPLQHQPPVAVDTMLLLTDGVISPVHAAQQR
jgi:hypothetical protein